MAWGQKKSGHDELKPCDTPLITATGRLTIERQDKKSNITGNNERKS
jgi:hypothetical protein